MVDSLLTRRLNAGAKERGLYEKDCQSATSALTAEESISSHQTMSDAHSSRSTLGSVKSSSANQPSNKKHSSLRRRGSATGATAAGPSDDLEPKKPRSQRRRSLFGSTQADEDEPKKPTSMRRRSALGSTTAEAEATNCTPDVSDDSLEMSVGQVPPKPSSRRRGSLTLFGSSPACEEEQKPSSVRRRSLLGSVLSADTEKAKIAKDAGSVTSRSVTSKNSYSSEGGGSLVESSPRKPKSRRRLSLTLKSKSSTAAEGDEERKKEKPKKKEKSKKKNSEDELKKPSSRRRNSLGGGSTHSDSERPEKPRSRRNSLSCSSTHSVSSVDNNINVHDYITELREKRGLQKFSRNMLMDTIAKQVSKDLAASQGAKCTPTNYYGNVGQGESVGHILETMTKRKGTARDNILNPHFREFGLGMAKGKDGLVYMCQVFK